MAGVLLDETALSHTFVRSAVADQVWITYRGTLLTQHRAFGPSA